MDRGVLRALFVVKRLLACGVLASACSLNPQGEDPGLLGGAETQRTSDEQTPSFVPGGTDGMIVDGEGSPATDPNGIQTPVAPAGPGAASPDGALVDPGSPTAAPETPPVPAGAGGAAPGDDETAASGGSGVAEEPSAGAAGSPEEAEGDEFDGGTFNYGAPEEGDAGHSDAGQGDAGVPADGDVAP